MKNNGGIRVYPMYGSLLTFPKEHNFNLSIFLVPLGPGSPKEMQLQKSCVSFGKECTVTPAGRFWYHFPPDTFICTVHRAKPAVAVSNIHFHFTLS